MLSDDVDDSEFPSARLCPIFKNESYEMRITLASWMASMRAIVVNQFSALINHFAIGGKIYSD